MRTKTGIKAGQQFWQAAWSIFGSTPIWLKIMGIVLFPLLMVVLVSMLYARQSVYGFIASQESPINLKVLFYTLTEQAFLVIGITLAVGISLAYVLSRILELPLSNILAVIRRVEEGDLSARVPVWAEDEIGQVQAAFNKMTTNLEKSQVELLDQNRDLAAVNELAEALTLGKGVDTIMEIALKKVITLMQFDVGSIYLLDKDTNSLKLKASQGFLPPDFFQQMGCLENNNYLLKSLLENGDAIVIEDIRTADELLGDIASCLLEEGFVSWACATLKIEGEVIGVYHLGKKTRQQFSPHDRSLLEIIGNVVGSSLYNAKLLKDLRYKEWELRRALHRSVDLQEEERKRLARELHDEVGQALTSILIRLKTVQEEKDFETALKGLDNLRSLTSQTIEELRRIAADLRPAALDSLGIIPALRWYVKQSTEMTGIPIELNAPDRCDRLSSDIELILYRVAQEGITNAIRHGKARNIDVTLERNEQSISLSVTDNGKGFDEALLDHGLGLIGVRERVEMLDGKFQINSSPRAGTRLSIEIPL